MGATALSTTANPRGWCGEQAEVGHWDRVLDEAEILALADGASPDHFADGLLFYVDYIRDKTERASASSLLTDGSNTVVGHPRILYPASPEVVGLELAGLTVSGSWTPALPLPSLAGDGSVNGAAAGSLGLDLPILSLAAAGNLTSPPQGSFETSLPLPSLGASGLLNPTVTLVSPPAASQQTRPDITLEWTYNGTYESFDVEVYLDAGLTTLEYSTSVVGTSVSTGDELENDRTYYWRVRPVIDSVAGSWSSTFNFQTEPAPVTMAHPLGRGVAALTLADVTPSSIYWFSPYRAADFPEVSTGGATYFALYSTDHDAGVGGIYWGTFSSLDLSDFVEQGKIWDANDSGGSNDQTETPWLVRNPDDSNGRTLYLYFHEEDTSTTYSSLTAQQTRLISSTGGALHSATWVDEGAVMPHSASSPHTGYQHVVRRGAGDWVSWGLDQGGSSASFAFRTSTDGKTWTIDTEPLPNTAGLPTDPHDKYQLSSFGAILSVAGERHLLTGIVNDGSFGGSSGRGRVALTQFPTDITFGDPFYVLVDTWRDATGSETDNLRAVFGLVEDDSLHIYYQTDNNIFYATAELPPEGALGLTLPAPALGASGSVEGTVTGGLAAGLPPPTLAASGVVSHVGTLAETLPTPALAASGATSGALSGTLAETLPLPTPAASGVVSHVGTLAETLPLPALDASGSASSTIPGTLAETLPMVALSAAGNVRHTGQIALDLLQVQLAASGSLNSAIAGDVAITLPVPTLAAAGSAEHTGSFAVTLPLPALSSAGLAVTAHSGTLAGALPLPDLDASGAASAGNAGQLTLALLVPGLDAAGVAKTAGQLAEVLPLPSLAAAGIVNITITGLGSLTLPAPALAASGNVEVPTEGAMDLDLPVAVLDAIGVRAGVTAGALAAALPLVTLSAAAQAAHAGTLGAVLPLPVLSASGAAQTALTGALASSLPLIQAAINGTALSPSTLAGPLAMVLPTPDLASVGYAFDQFPSVGLSLKVLSASGISVEPSP